MPFFDRPAAAGIYFNEVILDANWSYHLTIWVGKDVYHSLHVLQKSSFKSFVGRKAVNKGTDFAFVGVCVLSIFLLLVNLSSEEGILHLFHRYADVVG